MRSGPRRRDGRILDLDGGQAFGRILRARGHEHHVLVRPDARQRTRELPRVRLGSAAVAGRERQE